MKFLHTADLHIGKTVHEFSMLAEQKNMLAQIVKIAAEETVDFVIIAGDVYDRAVPSTEAVLILDEFLTSLLKLQIKIVMIAGNHDSSQRLQFANKILEKQGLYIIGNLEEREAKSILFEDEYGKVQLDFIPFLKPAQYGVKTTQAAMEQIIEKICIPDIKNLRRVCVAHLFVTNAGILPELSDSESGVYVGGLDNVDASLFSEYDYVALGHIHKPQRIGEKEIYYSGSPLKYSFSEANIDKSVNLVALGDKGKICVEQKVIKPLHDMRKIKGCLSQLTNKNIVGSADSEDYIQATLTDEAELIDPIGVLRSVYPNVCQIIIQKNYGEAKDFEKRLYLPQRKTIYDMFSEFYDTVTGNKMDDKRKQMVLEMIEEVKE